MRRAVVAAMLLLALTACGASTTPSAPTTTGTLTTGTLTGRVTAGPTCPVERPDHPCPPAAVSATIQAMSVQGRIVGSTRTDAAGRYVLDLRPGSYVVDALTRNAFPRCTPVNVTVKADHTTRAPLSCDTGIR